MLTLYFVPIYICMYILEKSTLVNLQEIYCVLYCFCKLLLTLDGFQMLQQFLL